MRVTVAIPTLGRFEEVKRVITDLLSGTRLPDEILVSDQNNPVLPELKDFLDSIHPIVRRIETRPLGVVFNMNSLLRQARGDIVIFLDDDVEISTGLVSAHAQNYEDDSISGVAGRVEQPTGDLPASTVTSVGQFNRWTGRAIFRFNGLIRQRCVFAQGANMSFRKSLLVEAGGFDEGFIGNGYFYESEASLRITKVSGKTLVFDPNATLKHIAAPRGGARIHDRSIHNAFFCYNALRFHRQHCPSAVLPVTVLKIFFVTIAKALFRRDFKIASRGLSAIAKGLRQDLGKVNSFQNAS